MNLQFRFSSLVISLIIYAFVPSLLPAQYSNCQFLCNIDFEQDVLVSSGRFGFFDQAQVVCWNTTASDRKIEIWGSGFGGVPAYSGNQFAELNANMVSTLFQRFKAGLGGSVAVSFAHRGRAGVDVMSVEVGPEGGPYQNLGSFSAGNSKWEFHEVQFVFPKTGRTDYVIRFNSVSAAGGATVGNFLDAISIKLIPPIAFYSISNPDCEESNNGSIKLDSIKGSFPYLYKWSTPNVGDSSSNYNLKAGHYEIEIIDLYGCSNKLQFELVPKHISDTVLFTQQSCESFFWNVTNTEYFHSGEFLSKTKNKYGCDSINKLKLTIRNANIDTIFHRTCGNFYWDISKELYNKSGFYSVVMQNKDGCDSVLTLQLELHPINITILDTTVCQSIYWPLTNSTLKSSGTYIDTLINTLGCDSLVVLNLKIDTAILTNTRVESCGEYYWPAEDKVIINSGFYTKTFNNIHGCDSLVSLNLTIHPKYLINDSISHCDAYFWNIANHYLDSTGLYKHEFKTIYGCDSIYQLLLNINASTVTDIDFKECDSVNVIGSTYFSDTSNRIILSGIHGCDSILQLNIIIFPSSTQQIQRRECESYYWDAAQSKLDESGIYTWHGKTFHGCDSAIQLELVIDKSYHFYDTVLSYKPFLWSQDQITYSTDKDVIKTFSTAEGCDSIYYLSLKIEEAGDVWEPNVFSPNQDAVNDYFTIYSTPTIHRIELLQIFDRWGNLVFERTNFPPNNDHYGWDGTFKNEKLSSGVFAYYVLWNDLNNQSRIHQGNVTLIR